MLLVIQMLRFCRSMLFWLEGVWHIFLFAFKASLCCCNVYVLSPFSFTLLWSCYFFPWNLSFLQARVIEFLRHGCENHSQSATDALSDGGSSAGDDILRRLGARSSMFADSLFRSPSLGPSDTFRQQLFRNLLRHNELGPIVFITPELAPWSTIGGVGVMVAELTEQLSRFLPDVIVISPYYNFNRNGETGYLDRDGIKWARNITTHVGPERVDVGVHVGRLESDNRTLLFLHQHFHFPSPVRWFSYSSFYLSLPFFFWNPSTIC